MERDVRRPFDVLLTLAIACVVAAPSLATTATPSRTPTRTATCGSTATPYCADQCIPCPTIRAGCYAGTCGECHENPVCGPGEACAREGLGACCACATFTPTPVGPTPVDTPTPGPSRSATPIAICDGDCNADGAVTVDELIAAVRVALGESPTHECDGFDADHDGMVTVNELVALVANALIGCTEIDLTGVDGVYEAEQAGAPSLGGPGLAEIGSRGRDLRIDVDFGIGASLGIDARQDAHGRFALSGGGISNGDLAFSVQGRGTLLRELDGSRFVATLEVRNSPTLEAFTVTLERPAAGTPADFTGTYRLRLQHGGSGTPFSSSIDLAVAVDASGHGTCDATRDVRDDDTVLAALAAAECLLSPRGRFSYRSPYESGSRIELLFLSGELIRAGGDGGGFFSIGQPPFESDSGIWQSMAIE